MGSVLLIIFMDNILRFENKFVSLPQNKHTTNNYGATNTRMAEFPDKNDQKNRPRDYHVITIILNIYGSFGGKVTTYFVTLQ